MSSQFHFAAGHLQNFKHFGSKSKQLYKLVDHSERAFYESEFPEKEFAPKYYGSDGDFIILDNLLYEMKNHVVMDIKMSRKSKRQECGEEKVLKEKAKEKQSTSEKYGFRIIGFTTPDRKEGGILTSDEDVVGRLLRIVVTKDNQSRFCEFLQAMSQLLRTVHRRYFNTSIVLIKGDTRSDIKWIDFRYWGSYAAMQNNTSPKTTTS